MRYPGGKTYIANKILDYFKQYSNEDTKFVDVFSGGLTMTIEYAKKYPQVKNFWINDKDPALASLWTCYIQYPPNLYAVLRTIHPTLEMFYSVKKELAALTEPPISASEMLQVAAKKVMLHQCSYSGLGLMGGAQGGLHQTGEDKITTNWNPDYQRKKINQFRDLFLNKFFHEDKCTCLDFSAVIEQADENCILYLDPPYYEMGNKLYYYAFNDEQHKRLANYLKHTPRFWVLSYDDCPQIRSLYTWANIDTITNDNRLQMSSNEDSQRKAYTKNELIITPKL